jgi:hypothetical protein
MICHRSKKMEYIHQKSASPFDATFILSIKQIRADPSGFSPDATENRGSGQPVSSRQSLLF